MSRIGLGGTESTTPNGFQSNGTNQIIKNISGGWEIEKDLYKLTYEDNKTNLKMVAIKILFGFIYQIFILFQFLRSKVWRNQPPDVRNATFHQKPKHHQVKPVLLLVICNRNEIQRYSIKKIYKQNNSNDNSSFLFKPNRSLRVLPTKWFSFHYFSKTLK